MTIKIHRIIGYITKAEVFSPYQAWGSEKRIHRIFLEPFDPYIYAELEYEAKMRELYATQPFDSPDAEDHLKSETELMIGTQIKFQNINRPRLTGQFKKAESDEDLYRQNATIISSMVTLKDGNSLMNIVAIDHAIPIDRSCEEQRL